MQEFIIQKEEAGQTVMKYLARLLPEASMGLLRKSMRKKNIVLNGKKIEGREKIAAGDSVKVWFSDETIEKFRKKKEESPKRDYPDFEAWVLYEDENIVILNKPAGLLSQGDTSGAPSLNEALLAARESRAGVKPSICHRLDRNTSGLVVAGKTVRGLQEMASGLRLSRVHFQGAIYGDEKHNLFRSAELFVLPTHTENFGMAVAEALARGIPVITTRGTPWAGLESTGSGWWIERHLDTMVASLDAAMQASQSQLADMGASGRQWMVRDFGWPSIAEAMTQGYQWLLSGGLKPECVHLD